MKITLLPSAVSAGAGDRGYYLSSYLINDTIAIDAGGLGLLGGVDVQSRVEHIFLTHSHIDHIASLPIFLETVFQTRDRCVTLHASTDTLDCLRRDIFNDRVWPDFIAMSDRGLPFVKVETIQPDQTVEVAGLRLHPHAVDHVVPTLGYLIEAPGVTVAIPSDTGPTDDFWNTARGFPDLKAVFLEASFPNDMDGLAKISKHLTPNMFASELGKLNPHVQFIAVHIKPRFYDTVVSELGHLNLPNLRIGLPGESYDF